MRNSDRILIRGIEGIELMNKLVARHPSNPLIRPIDLKPSIDGWEIIGVLNPGAFEYRDSIGLVLRVAERPPQVDGSITVAYYEAPAPTVDRTTHDIRLRTFDLADFLLDASDRRMIVYDGLTYLTSISSFRIAWSTDGERFDVEEFPCIRPSNLRETYGIEDARATQIDDTYHLTYSEVSENGVCVGYSTTSNWREFDHHGAILPPPNKDVAIFPGSTCGTYRMLHRPSDEGFGGINMWICESQDLSHWGNHEFLAGPRLGMWDSVRIGAGAAPILTREGWLEIYHGADETGRYCLGAMLLDRDTPSRVLARSTDPIMEPVQRYEQEGFYGHCIFTNGHVVRDGSIEMFYGASDTVVCKATISIDGVFDSLR
jgi:beta-1,2-mannobiose phosphorylase / 1,2-beta-oligomannan phosphorylase